MSRQLDAIATVADALGELRDEVAFVGGSILGLLITDPAAAPPRITYDVDLIVEVTSTAEYHELSERLRALGFVEDSSPRAPICRWLLEKLKVDVMPTSAEVLGFSNRWSLGALTHAEPAIVRGGLSVRRITAPIFWRPSSRRFPIADAETFRLAPTSRTSWRLSTGATRWWTRSRRLKRTFGSTCAGVFVSCSRPLVCRGRQRAPAWHFDQPRTDTHRPRENGGDPRSQTVMAAVANSASSKP
jgi:hypothetical protein